MLTCVNEARDHDGEHMLDATHISSAGRVRSPRRPRPKQLILSHYDPTGLPDSHWLDVIKQNYAGKNTVAKDGQVFAL
jgi:ribonuclease BN (tRNA processing enzyme)